MQEAQPQAPQGPTYARDADEIDLRELFMALWEKRLWIFGSSLLCLMLSAVYAYTAPKTFESSALLIPTESPKADQLGAAAALLGKKSGSSGDIDLYQSLLTSRTVLHKLLKSPLPNLSDTGKGKVEPLFQIIGVDTTNPRELRGTVDGLAKAVRVVVTGTGSGGILQVTLSAGEPWLAQEINDRLLEIGQTEIRLVRVQRSEAVLERLESAAGKARAEWDSATDRLATYRDENRSANLTRQQVDIERLTLEKQVKEQKYLMARREVEAQVLDREKAAPPAVILDPADLPASKSKPKRILIMALGLVLGTFASTSFVLARKAFVAQ